MIAEPQSTPAATPQELIAQALEAIRRYQRGGSRGALLVSDQAASIAQTNPASRAAFQDGLIALLRGELSDAAAEHACRQLGLVGSGACAGILVSCLGKANRVNAACQALDAIRDPAVDAALRGALPGASGAVRLALIDLIGRRRDARGLRALGGLLKTGDEAVLVAVAGAMASIGTRAAAALLRTVLKQSGIRTNPRVLDACLECAERLAPSDKGRNELLGALEALELPPHARDAVKRLRAIKAS
jgi:hypothetical protein